MLNGKLAPLKLSCIRRGIFYYKGRTLLKPASSLTEVLIAELHDTPTGGHSGYVKTLHRLRKVAY